MVEGVPVSSTPAINPMGIKDLFLNTEKYSIDNKILNQDLIIKDIENLDEELILLVKNSAYSGVFFKAIGDLTVLNQNLLIKLLFQMNSFIPGSFTEYGREIGLFLSKSEQVSLDFPFKDCVLLGGMDSEQQKVDVETFFNQTIDRDKIDSLFEPKIFTNSKRFSYIAAAAVDDKVDNPRNIIQDDNTSFFSIDSETGKTVLTDNLLLKGNNLIGLHTLAHKFAGMVDVIYIDPPYYFNKTKPSDTFAYNSNFKLSTWLTFMKNRLEIARELLSDDGVVFISINNDGNSHLKLLCDDIFGISNFLANMTWDKGNAQNDAENIQENNEFVLVYQKKSTKLIEIKVVEEKVIEKNGRFFYKNSGITTGGDGGTLNKRPTLGYSIYYNKTTNDVLAVNDYNRELAKTSNDETLIYDEADEELIKNGYVCIRPGKKGSKLGCWTWNLEKFNAEREFISVSDGLSISTLKEVRAEDVFERSNELFVMVEKKSPLKSIIKISSGAGTSALKILFGDKVFQNSKPVGLVEFLIKTIAKNNGIILDFFAGSGTTAHAVLKLNKDDGGSRKFILLEQMDYIESLTAERIKRVMIKEEIEGSFVYAELMSTPVKSLLLNAESIDEVKAIINTYFDQGYFQYVKNQEELQLKVESLIGQKDELNLVKKIILERHFDYNMEYVSYKNLIEHDTNLTQSDQDLNKSFYSEGI